ncbi:MAG: carboxypeptidase-like regulatory domain-containing protein [Tepidisphaeraceae bacterium]
MFKILFSLLFFLASPTGQFQTPASDPRECAVQGVVVNASGGEFLRKAVVTLCMAGTSNHCTGAVTDATGQFEIRGIFPGRFELSATRNGYIEQPYGQRTPGGSGVILTLSPGQKLSGLSLRLTPAAVISGHVYDEDGAPVADAVVSDLHLVYMNGQRQLRKGAVVRTNDLGEYRIWGLAEGTHFVLAEYLPTRLATTPTELGYLPIFYPGVLEAVHAAPIMVRSGDEFAGANIDLQPAHTVRIRGHVYGAVQNIKVFLLLRDISAIGVLVPPLYAQERNGDYELYNVTPGSYYLYATGQGLSGQMMSRQLLEVNDTNLDHADVALVRGTNLSGSTHIEGISVARSLQVSLLPKNGRTVFGSALSTLTSPSGGFALENVYPGDYDVEVDDLGGSYYLKSARLDGADVLARGLSTDLYPNPTRLDILIGRNGATIDGVVTKDQQPYSGATVALVPDPPHRSEQHLFKTTSTDQFGRFVMEGVPPGDYKVFAWECIEHAAYTSSDFLQPFELRGESAHVSESSHVTLNLDLIPKTEVDQ